MLLAFLSLACSPSIVAARPYSAANSKGQKVDPYTASLTATLLAGSLEQPEALASTLRELGLHYMKDIHLLNAVEEMELIDALRTAGISLGSRSKLRLLANRRIQPTGARQSMNQRHLLQGGDDVHSVDVKWHTCNDNARRTQADTGGKSGDNDAGVSMVSPPG